MSEQNSQKKFIAIAGNMGAGKTTMVRYLHSHYGVHPVYEPFMDNPYLDDFYTDMKRWAFHSQMYFLTHKFRLHMEMTTPPIKRSFWIARSTKMLRFSPAIYTALKKSLHESLKPIWNCIKRCSKQFNHQIS